MSQADAALVVGGLALAGALIAAVLTYVQSSRANFYRALDWLSGKSQRRTLGIATLENLWNSPFPGFDRVPLVWRFAQVRNLSVPLLESSGFYLLMAAEKPLAPHELRNLDRIMTLLITTVGRQHYKRYRKVYDDLEATLEKAAAQQTPKFKDGCDEEGEVQLEMLNEKIEKWNRELQQMRYCAEPMRRR